MVRIKLRSGYWKNKRSELMWEKCPNPKCENFGDYLHYPDWMVEPHCPQCKSNLPGQTLQLVRESSNRVNFHLSS